MARPNKLLSLSNKTCYDAISPKIRAKALENSILFWFTFIIVNKDTDLKFG